MYKYFPHTEDDLRAMLDKVGVDSLDALFSDIPEAIRFCRNYQLPEAMSELELRKFFQSMTSFTLNTPLTVFAGAGIYDHYAPSVVQNLIQRSEFLTSYTPYQAEISQGTLHYIFEYQSMMAELTGMDISNASMYDGATATAEAVMMAFANAKKADTVLLSSTLDPKVRQVVETYAHYHGIKIELIAEEDGIVNLSTLNAQLSTLQGVAGVVVQSPNYYSC